MADTDERIRAFLDLGDSSPATKRLNEEIDQLLGKLKKLTEDFGAGKVAPQEFAASTTKLRGEIGGLSGSLDQLASPGRVDGMDKITKTLFGLERGLGALASGTGLGRAGGLLEAGLSMFGGAGGMGLGFGIAMLANTIDNVLPKVQNAWEKFTTGVDPEKAAEIKKQLADIAASYRSFVEAMEAKAAPGSEQEQGFIQARLARMFNLKTLKGPGGIENAVLSAALHKEVSDMKRSEIDDISKLEQQRAAERQKLAEGALPGMGGGAAIKQEIARLDKEIQDIEQTAASRTRDKLLKEASNPDTPEGQTALKQLRSLAQNHPEQFPAGFARRITEILEGVKPAPTVADLRVAQELSEAAWQQTPSRVHRQRIEREMARRQQVIERMEAHPEIDWNDPEKRQSIDRALHPDRYGERGRGEPPPLRHPRRLTREQLARFGGQLPHIASREDQEEAEERAKFARLPMPGPRKDFVIPPAQPAQFHRPLHAPAPAPALADPFAAQLGEITAKIHEREAMAKKMAGLNAAIAAEVAAETKAIKESGGTPQTMSGFYRHMIEELGEKQSEAFKLEREGLVNHAKTQQVVASIQQQINELRSAMRVVGKAADSMLRNQQRSNQNEGGNP